MSITIDSLFGIAVRRPFAPVLAWLGAPTRASTSPDDGTGSRFASYEWHSHAPPLAVLTWIAEDGEWV